MKKLIMSLAIAAMVAFAATAFATIAGSGHDFSNINNMTACGGCHKPHNASSQDMIPLWTGDQEFTSTYTKYVSPTGTFDAADNVSSTLASASKVCMTCHDGTVSNLGTLSPDVITFDGGSNHPIGFPYTAATATDDGLVTESQVEGTGLRLFGEDKTMECATCHDPHGTRSSSGSGNIPQFLRVSKSSLCNSCHMK